MLSCRHGRVGACRTLRRFPEKSLLDGFFFCACVVFLPQQALDVIWVHARERAWVRRWTSCRPMAWSRWVSSMPGTEP